MDNEGRHDACGVEGPHLPHEVVIQYIDVGVGGPGIPEYGLCPGVAPPGFEVWLAGVRDLMGHVDDLERGMDAAIREVLRLRSTLESHAPEGHNATNAEFVRLSSQEREAVQRLDALVMTVQVERELGGEDLHEDLLDELAESERFLARLAGF